MEKIKTDKVIIVEGKYDKIKLSSFIDGHILTTDGFSIFNNKEKCALIRMLSEKCGIVILTDSDGAGFVIRNKIKSIAGGECDVVNLYAPQIVGKEARKKEASKQGYLGVEGLEIDTLREIFKKAHIDGTISKEFSSYNKKDLYFLGLSGQNDSSKKRDEICKDNDLPLGMSANAFLEAVNLLGIRLD